MRGKVKSSLKCLPQLRITPAYAGKSPAVAVADLRYKDHPRKLRHDSKTAAA